VERRVASLLGSFVFFWIAPATVAGWIPWMLTRWSLEPALLGAPASRWLGVLLVIAGATAVIECFARFALEGRGTPAPVAPTESLVVTGLYRYVRNPMYVGVVAAIAGQALLFGSVVLLEYGALVWMAFFAFVVLYEEPALHRQFGSTYDDYRAHVRRWWPRITPWRGPGAMIVAMLLCAGSAPPSGPFISILMEVEDEDRRELPAEFTGAWRRLPEYDLRDIQCITSDPEHRSMTVYSLEFSGGQETWRAREKGSAFVVDGVVYAYLLDQITNLAIGRIVRFEGTGESRTLSMLDPDVLRRALEERGLPMTRTTNQIRVDAKSVIEVLRQGRVSFFEIARGRRESTKSPPPCPEGSRP
jgi:protein-S-isoprenylcysteine O-methyltransferase Ste14